MNKSGRELFDMYIVSLLAEYEKRSSGLERVVEELSGAVAAVNARLGEMEAAAARPRDALNAAPFGDRSRAAAARRHDNARRRVESPALFADSRPRR